MEPTSLPAQLPRPSSRGKLLRVNGRDAPVRGGPLPFHMQPQGTQQNSATPCRILGSSYLTTSRSATDASPSPASSHLRRACKCPASVSRATTKCGQAPDRTRHQIALKSPIYQCATSQPASPSFHLQPRRTPEHLTPPSPQSQAGSGHAMRRDPRYGSARQVATDARGQPPALVPRATLETGTFSSGPCARDTEPARVLVRPVGERIAPPEKVRPATNLGFKPPPA